MPQVAVDQRAAEPAVRSRKSGERLSASPLARRVAARRGYSLDALTGSGPHGRIVLKDVPPEPAPSENQNVRADAVVRLSMEVRLDPLLRLLDQITEANGHTGLDITDCLAKAVAIALMQRPHASKSATGVVLARAREFGAWTPLPGAQSLSLSAIGALRTSDATNFDRKIQPCAQVEDLGPLGVLDAQLTLDKSCDFAFALGAPTRASVGTAAHSSGSGAVIARLNAATGPAYELPDLAQLAGSIRDLLEAPLSFIP